MMRTLILAFAALAGAACARSFDPLEYVDPFIGTGFHGHTYPGAATPFGMVQLSPDTRADDWDACAGYHYDDTTIDGFSHTHLSGTGCADLADILFHPTTRTEVVCDGEYLPQPYAFSHDRERASCGYYAVELPEEGLAVELTAAPRTGVHRYAFRGAGPRRVVIDLMHTITDEKIDLRELRQTAPDEIAGMRRTQGWVSDHYVVFSARFSEPFDEFMAGRDYTEATPWQYRFFAPHDVNGLEQLFGGREAFVRELDRLFTLESPHEDAGLVDITGLMGQYAHGNEPSHHMAYLYSYVGQPWKTQELTRRLLDEMYAPTPEGIIGNEDCGQMSAWYIFSSLGFYPVCPGSNEFVLTAPLFEKATVRLANGRTLTVTADKPRRNRYVGSVTLDGQTIDKNFITYDQLMEGGELHFEMVPQPAFDRASDPAAQPYSLTRGEAVSIPYTTQSVSLFTEPVDVALATTTPGAEIRYTLDGSEPDSLSALYRTPLRVDRSLTLCAKGFKAGAAPSQTLTLRAEKAVSLSPAAAAATVPGVRFAYYEGTFSKVADITRGKFVSTGVIAAPSIAEAPQEDHFGYVFEGLIRIPERGVWEFFTRSDDGSVLLIDGRKVVDNDSSHAAVTATGRVALEAGLHACELLYFEDYEGQELEWGWKAPGEAAFSPIPAENLFVK